MRPITKHPISLVLCAMAVWGRPAGAATTGQAPDTMTATVQQVNVQDSTVALVYGTSLALKVVEIAVAPHCHVSLKGTEAGLGDVRRGQVVRIRYRTGPDGAPLAEAIEVLRNPEDEP
jgi:hypothetical protein